MPLPYDSTRTALYCPESAETLFGARKLPSEHALLAECARLAYCRAEESEESKTRLTSTLSLVGFGAPKLFTHAGSGTYAFGAQRAIDGAALIAFRGTQPDDATDIATDLTASWVTWGSGDSQVHRGFADAFRSLQIELELWLKDIRSTELFLTGHSLGGAIATLAASLYAPKFLITLGSPRVGNRSFCESVAHIRHVRFANCSDVVTRLPPSFSGYQHCGERHYIDQYGQIVVNPSDEAVSLDRAEAALRYFAEHAWRIGSVSIRDLADHAPANYLRVLF
jgi:Lipase (class 3)